MNQLALEAGFVAKLPNSPADGRYSCYLNITTSRKKIGEPPKELSEGGGTI
jgi:hypothetical protein